MRRVRIAKSILKVGLVLFLFPVLYVLVSLITSGITVNNNEKKTDKNKIIYLNTNGIHLDIVIPRNELSTEFLDGVYYEEGENYLSFGWGDEDFYLNTPEWSDLTFSIGFKALFLNSSTLIHLTRYNNKRKNWVEVKLDNEKLEKLIHYIQSSFQTDKANNKIMLLGESYSAKDNFYKANGSYSAINTCNSWVNTGFKQSGLRACLWTPYDFGLLRKYKNNEDQNSN